MYPYFTHPTLLCLDRLLLYRTICCSHYPLLSLLIGCFYKSLYPRIRIKPRQMTSMNRNDAVTSNHFVFPSLPVWCANTYPANPEMSDTNNRYPTILNSIPYPLYVPLFPRLILLCLNRLLLYRVFLFICF